MSHILGLGVYRLSPRDTESTVRAAIELGYPVIDTAQLYRNEAEVGRALTPDVRVTTKVHPKLLQGFATPIVRSVDRSLEALGRIDRLLLHRPTETFYDQIHWETLEELLTEKKVGEIGVSNYSPEQLRKLLEVTTIRPVVNQIERSPFCPHDLEPFRELGVPVSAHSPLTKGERLADRPLIEAARKLGITPAQLLLAWGLRETDLLVGSKNHLAENRAATEITLPDELVEEMVDWADGYKTHPKLF